MKDSRTVAYNPNDDREMMKKRLISITVSGDRISVLYGHPSYYDLLLIKSL